MIIWNLKKLTPQLGDKIKYHSIIDIATISVGMTVSTLQNIKYINRILDK